MGVIRVHPFYGPSRRLVSGGETGLSGLVSMAAYLAFWAAALVVAKREVDARWPRRPGSPGAVGEARADPALAVLRERFARGELDEAAFRAMAEVLRATDGRP